MKYIDIHAHLNDLKYESNEIDEVINKAEESNVVAIINAGWDLQSSKTAKALSNTHKSLFFCCGIHPENVEGYNEKSISEVEKLADDKKCVAIGEIGLDYHYEGFDKDRQKKIFIEQLELAHSLNLPVVIHSRDCPSDMTELIKQNKNLLKDGVLLHCFSESAEIAREMMKFDVFFSFGGAVTFKNAKNIYTLKDVIPVEKILSETDCPYMTPHPHRGERNEPKYIPLIVTKLAEIYSVEEEKLAGTIIKNAFCMFPKLMESDL